MPGSNVFPLHPFVMLGENCGVTSLKLYCGGVFFAGIKDALRPQFYVVLLKIIGSCSVYFLKI